MGGIIHVESGLVKGHIMSELKKIPMKDGSKELTEWLR